MACGELLQYLRETERNFILIHHFLLQTNENKNKTPHIIGVSPPSYLVQY